MDKKRRDERDIPVDVTRWYLMNEADAEAFQAAVGVTPATTPPLVPLSRSIRAGAPTPNRWLRRIADFDEVARAFRDDGAHGF